MADQPGAGGITQADIHYLAWLLRHLDSTDWLLQPFIPARARRQFATCIRFWWSCRSGARSGIRGGESRPSRAFLANADLDQRLPGTRETVAILPHVCRCERRSCNSTKTGY